MQFLYSRWLELPISTRHRIAGELGIAKRGSTHVQDNRIVSDGYNIQEVEAALNLDALQRLLHSESTDMAILWDLLVNSTPTTLPKIEELPIEKAEKIEVITPKHEKAKKSSKK